jgi:diguanylate cyclase (GGDEF)-like protein
VLAHPKLTVLLASPDPALLAALEPPLAASGANVHVVLSLEAAQAALTVPHPPGLVLLDVNLPANEPGMTIDGLVTALRADAAATRFPIILIADNATAEWTGLLAGGLIDDLLARAADPCFLLPRIKTVLRAHKMAEELELLREAAALNAQLDRLTGVYNREAMLAMLFRETDRVQRMKSSLCLVLFDIDDFGHWNMRLGSEACDELLCQVVTRATRMLRSYDLLGRAGKDEFLVGMPGCNSGNAAAMAARLRQEVFGSPFHVEGQSVRLSACFGIASSMGRSPVVVLREAEQALHSAQMDGEESIQCFGEPSQPATAPVAFFSPLPGDDLLAW